MLKGRDVNGWGFQQNPDVNELIVGEIVKHGGGGGGELPTVNKYASSMYLFEFNAF